MFLYHLRDWHTHALAPVRFWARAALGAFESPFLASFRNGLTQKVWEDFALIERRSCVRERVSFDISSSKFRGVNVKVTQERSFPHPFSRIIHFKRRADNESTDERLHDDPQVLIIPPLSGHFASLLHDTVDVLLPSHDLSVVDWIDAKEVPLSFGPFNLEDQIAFLANLIGARGPGLHVLAIGQASFAALAAVALLAADRTNRQPLSLSLIGGPIDSDQGFSAFREMVRARSLAWFENNHIQITPPYYSGAFRRICPGLLQVQSRRTVAMKNPAAEMTHYFQHLTRGDGEMPLVHERLYDEFLSVMDTPAELYLQFIEQAYIKRSLAQGTMTCKGKPIDLGAIKKTALLTVEAELDDVCPPGQTLAARDLCTGLPPEMKEDHLEIGVGAYGVFSGKKWRDNVAPAIHRFIRKHALGVDEG